MVSWESRCQQCAQARHATFIPTRRHELEPSDGVFNFTKLDTILDLAAELELEVSSATVCMACMHELQANRPPLLLHLLLPPILQVMLGTPTATMPAWLHAAHPDVMHKGPDSPEGYAGATAGFGGRRQYSFNSET